MENDNYKVQTSVGIFRVYKTTTHLRIGGNKFCVDIKLYDSGTPAFSELQWLITKEGGCELNDKLIQGDSTVHLLNLSLTILKLYREVQFIKLLDNSKYLCEFSDKTTKNIYINKYNYLFHGGTWYDEKMNAVPIDPDLKKLYDETKYLYTDPSAKPQVFDFRNKSLEIELTPIYDSTNTWKEFAELLHKKYDKKTLCQKISPWYEYAVAILTNNRMLPEFWKIDITGINIPFTRVIVKEGGGRRTRKNKYRLPNNEDYMMSPSELYDKNL
jgi:hypothetical protein